MTGSARRDRRAIYVPLTIVYGDLGAFRHADPRRKRRERRRQEPGLKRRETRREMQIPAFPALGVSEEITQEV